MKGVDVFEAVEGDGDFVVEGHVGAEEVVEGDEESGEGGSAVF